ncbi:diacylglycerol/lipid kinase family protein [Formosa maritima]|uniref:Diacylglycerol kinase family lipid kinase n=1 Tax=Formosa maritima TaxID=2592046 RepID=A0A5D0G2B5_9FLAO|nr:diacylglycerol kinase family protein [Formosa maritima]TYA52202.1 diacylglycerol kinase family lipid kinase [Formosa maritima]
MTNNNLWFVIINPTSGNGASKKKWPEIERLLKTYKFEFEFMFTEHENHSIYLVQNAINQGFINIICIGGDGTLHNVVNGIMLQNVVPSNLINVGVIPIGTGNDWVKTHGITNHFENAIITIKNGALKTQDVGKIIIENKFKTPMYFINLAGIGFDGFVVSKVNKYKHLGAIAYLSGALLGLFSFKNFHSKVCVNSSIIESKTLMILIGICQYSGGGMQLTKTPNPFDGLLDISIVKNIGKIDILKNVVNLFNGKITNHKKVVKYKCKSIKVEITDSSKPFIQADGELLGTGNLEISIVPKAFSFYC